MAAAVSGLSPVIMMRANAHGAQAGETVFDAAFDDVFEIDDAEGGRVLGDHERRAARAGDLLDAIA